MVPGDNNRSPTLLRDRCFPFGRVSTLDITVSASQSVTCWQETVKTRLLTRVRASVGRVNSTDPQPQEVILVQMDATPSAADVTRITFARRRLGIPEC
jgi:hypothetical protein